MRPDTPIVYQGVDSFKGAGSDLPTTNRIREALKNQGFREPIHNVDMVQLALLPELNTDVVIHPNSLEICHVHRSGVDNAELFWQISQIVLSEMGIWNDVHQQTQTVIGSPEYFHRSATWTWEVEGYEVRYSRGNESMDTLRVTLERD